MKDHIEFFQDGQGDWRWRVRDAENGKIIGRSSEGYKNRKEMEENLRRMGSINSREFTVETING